MSSDVFLEDPTDPTATPPKKILVCDDSPIERMALGQFLRQFGHHVDEVSEGNAAIAHIKQRHVDLYTHLGYRYMKPSPSDHGGMSWHEMIMDL